MNTTILMIFLAILIGLVLGLTGLIVLIYALINRKKRLSIIGALISGLALIIFVTGIFFGARRFFRIAFKKCNTDFFFHPRHQFGPQCMQFDEFMEMDSLQNNDSTQICIEKRVIVNGDTICCKNMKCDPRKCQTPGKFKQ